HPAGESVLSGPPGEVQEKLAHLGERSDVPGRLLHHLALIETRLAQSHEENDALLATLHGPRAWNAWLGFLASEEAPPPPAPAAPPRLARAPGRPPRPRAKDPPGAGGPGAGTVTLAAGDAAARPRPPARPGPGRGAGPLRRALPRRAGDGVPADDARGDAL